MGVMKDMILERMDLEARMEDTEDVLILRDTKRLIDKLDLIMKEQDTNLREYRYERRGDNYILQSWHLGKETTMRGHLDQRPEWLTNALSVARVGGHMKQIKEPPPDEILWFHTDADNNITSFVELDNDV